MIKLSYFEAFHAVMLSGSMTAAATMLNTSQPNISRSIARLENLTKLKLFERMPGKLAPTADAHSLFDEVQRSFVGLRRLTDAASRIQRSGSGILSLGAIQSLSLSLVPRAIKQYSEFFPEVSVSIHSGHSNMLSQWVREHTCDIAIVSNLTNDDGLDKAPLYTAAAVCIFPEGHRLADRDIVEPQHLSGERLIALPHGVPQRFELDKRFLEANIDMVGNIETSYSSITCSLVMQGVGVSVVNPFVAKPYLGIGLVARPFRPSLLHSGTLIFPKGKPKGRHVDHFVEILQQVVVDEKREIDFSIRNCESKDT